MRLIYNNVDITNKVDIIKALISDNCGGKADTISLLFSDVSKLWRNWDPQKNDELILSSDGFSSGIMYIDEASIISGKYAINAISTPLISKTSNSKSWENIRFTEIARQLVEEIGLTLETYEIEDYLYDRLDMIERTNLEFLNERCILEGYSLKITNKKAIIYDEKKLEKFEAVRNITEDLFIGPYSFNTISSGLYSTCLIEYFSNKNKLISYEFKPENAPIGAVLKHNLRAYSQGEAERYSKGLLRYANKVETTGSFYITLDTNLGAGNTINLKDLGSFSSKYFISSIIHNLTSGKSFVKVRKVLEGY